MKDSLQQFIEDNIDLIETNQFEKLFVNSYFKELTPQLISCLSDADVDWISYIRRIPEYCFFGNSQLQNFIVPNNIVEIGKYAFSGCKNLSSIQLSSNLKSIHDGAFGFCSNLETVIFSDSLQIISRSCFNSCSSLETIILPDSVKIILENAFFRCWNLKKVSIPKDINFIGDGIFSNCDNLSQVDYRGTIEEFNHVPFRGKRELAGNRKIVVNCLDGSIGV